MEINELVNTDTIKKKKRTRPKVGSLKRSMTFDKWLSI